ncbi:MAG TPA: agmatinase [Clostridia bacterium]|nr:agmatinase [Clostridia bacterium]HRX42500.1 agmatinase [Clostridia bacterium]
MIKDNRSIRHEGFRGTYDDSSIIVFGIPYDGTASYRPGTRFGPQALRSEIDGIETYSPYLDKDLADYRISDSGDLPFNFGSAESILSSIRSNVREILSDGKKTVAIGGEHLVSLPVIEAYLEKYPDLNVIHLDAHADLRDEFLGERLSHATVMRRVFEKMSGSLWQFGIRSGSGEEFAFGRQNTEFHPFTLDGMEKPLGELGQKPVYLTIDIDVLDPSIVPGTGTPEAGGVTFRELLDGLMKLNGLHIVGADIVELSPHYDDSGVSTAVACKVLREVLLLMV